MTIRSLCRASLLFAVLGSSCCARGGTGPVPVPTALSSYGPSAYGAPLDRSGLYLGLGAFGDGVINQANSAVDFLTSGAGYNLMIGFRLSPNFALELGLARDSITT